MLAKGCRFPLKIASYRDLMKLIRPTMYPSDDAKDYIKSLTNIAIEKGFQFQTDRQLSMDVVVCPRSKREIDAHNYGKVLCDAMQAAGVYLDDSQVVDLRIRLGPVMPPDGRMIISMQIVAWDGNGILDEVWGRTRASGASVPAG